MGKILDSSKVSTHWSIHGIGINFLGVPYFTFFNDNGLVGCRYCRIRKDEMHFS